MKFYPIDIMTKAVLILGVLGSDLIHFGLGRSWKDLINL